MLDQHTSTLGRFSIVSILGSEDRGQVYLAEDPQLQQRVALATFEFDESESQVRESFLEQVIGLVQDYGIHTFKGGPMSLFLVVRAALSLCLDLACG